MNTNHLIKRGALLYWAALFTLCAALIHFIGMLKQAPQSWVLVALLVVGTLMQASLAVATVAVPARRILLAAGVIEAVAVLIWLLAHSTGLPDGLTAWKAETLSVPDLFLPAIEALSAFFFLCLFGRTWKIERGLWRTILNLLPSLVLLGLLLWAIVNYKIAEVIPAIMILDAQVPTSLFSFFLPAVGLLVAFLLLRLAFPHLRKKTKGAGRTTLILLPALLVVNLLAWDGGTSAANTVWFPATASVRATPGQTTTLNYCNLSGSPLAMDLSEPSAQARRPAPVVFYIHGGEALLGSRTLDDGSADAPYFIQLRNELLAHGFVVGAIDYSLAPLNKVSEQVQDAKCAVRFLRAHASELGIDPQRIGVYGPSQGGYISSMLGTAGPAAGYDVGPYLNQSSRVQAVVDMWGPADLTDFSGSPSWISALMQGMSGGTASHTRLHTASPVTYVAPGDPPFLIIHGADDWFIAPHHSQGLAKLLQAAGVPTTLVIVKHNGHGLDAPTSGQVEQPTPSTLVHMISDFFVGTLS
jgi:acetyl esterase/lipase